METQETKVETTTTEKKQERIVLVPENVFIGWYQLTMKLPMEQVAGLYDALKGVKIINVDDKEESVQ